MAGGSGAAVGFESAVESAVPMAWKMSESQFMVLHRSEEEMMSNEIMARLPSEPGAWRAIVVEHGADGKPVEPEPGARRIMWFDVAAWGLSIIGQWRGGSMFGRFSAPDGNVDMFPLATPEAMAKGSPERLDKLPGYLGVAPSSESVLDAYDRLSGTRGMREAMERMRERDPSRGPGMFDSLYAKPAEVQGPEPTA